MGRKRTPPVFVPDPNVKRVDMTDVPAHTLYAKPKSSYLERLGIKEIHNGVEMVVNNGFNPKAHSLDRLSIESRRKIRGEAPLCSANKYEITGIAAYHNDVVATVKNLINKMLFWKDA